MTKLNNGVDITNNNASRYVKNDLYAWVELFHIKLLFYLD